ncbi:DUF1343 domain-containing protein [Gillisia sp. M10.2A]|uniref:DUF1343 domain-containing protein n=1 Tax=Gillisia lutea TaxID=2909668 RepID=A0ABS9EDM4_9FLAO|nr:DUF1343 domain-containing protein [Gillisia lutea]MCF4100961.1 DUF1343 domain-containing protein [Gillisia lutea]
MVYRFFKNTFLFAAVTIVSCGTGTSQNQQQETSKIQATAVKEAKPILVGANRTEAYLPLLKGKRVGIVGNQSTLIFKNSKNDASPQHSTHLVDSLISLGVDVKQGFAPEHGFRGTADAGEHVTDGKDPNTGLSIISLYGENRKPKSEQLKDIDILIFDLQDVGARFYTYISSLHYVMEACAENKVPLLILDRPNPNGHYTDGPILDPEYKSFVGMHPIPVVHGLTMGEYAQMINGQKWLKDGVQCDLRVIAMENYSHDMPYSLPIKPSPNLPNDNSINLYPSLCFFEGTNVNAGRGTENQFQVFGSPYLDKEFFDYAYTPQSRDGAKNPKHLKEECYGMDLTKTNRLDKINLQWLLDAYAHTEDKSKFFNAFFKKLAGGAQLQQQIENGLSAEEITASWQEGLSKYNEMRKDYLLYN